MQPEPINQKQVENAFLALAVINFFSMPLYLAEGNMRSGVGTALIVNALAVFLFHEIGRERRPLANTINRACRFFAASKDERMDSHIENAVGNIVEGGDAVLGRLADTFK